MTKFKRAAPAEGAQIKPKRSRPPSGRPTYLVLIAGADGLRLFSAHYDAPSAEAVVAQMEALLAATGHSVTVIEVPEIAGIAGLPAVPLKPIPALRPAAVTQHPLAAAMMQQAPAPTKFRRQSADEFQAETIAMMNGEIPIGGIPMRDADDPISDGGAMGL